MKNWKNAVLCIITLCVAVFAVYSALLFNKKDAFVFGDSVIYYTKEELTDLYKRHKGVLNAVKHIVVMNEKLGQLPYVNGRVDIDLYTPEIRACFSEKEWENIVYAFQELHPYTLTQETDLSTYSFVYRVNFGSLKLDAGSKTTSLCWFPYEEDRDFYKIETQKNNGVFTQIDEGWYIVEETYHW